MNAFRIALAGLLICCFIITSPAMAREYNAIVQKAQNELWVLGYDPGPADGRMGGKTHQAVRQFQEKQGLQVTGTLDPKTCDLISRLTYQRIKPRVKPAAPLMNAQKHLKALGYAPGTPDGKMGKRTKTALKRFQHDRGLPVTGKLSDRTAETLKKAVQKHGGGKKGKQE